MENNSKLENFFSKLTLKTKLICSSLIIILIFILYFVLIYKTDYQNGIISFKTGNYLEAIDYFDKVKNTDKDYDKAQKKLNISQGIYYFQKKRILNALDKLIKYSEEGISELYLDSAKNAYLTEKNISNLSLKIDEQSEKISGFFTEGCELILRISNQSNVPVSLEFNNIELVYTSKDNSYVSENNPNKNDYFNLSATGNKYTVDFKKNESASIMLNFDDIKSQRFVLNDKNFILADKYKIDFREDKLLFAMNNKFNLTIPISSIKLQNQSYDKKIEDARQQYLENDLNKFITLNKFYSTEDGVFYNNDVRLKTLKMDQDESGYRESFKYTSTQYMDTSKAFKFIVTSDELKNNEKTFKIKKEYEQKYLFDLSSLRITEPNLVDSIKFNNYRLFYVFKIKQVHIELSDYSSGISDVETIPIEFIVLDKNEVVKYKKAL